MNVSEFLTAVGRSENCTDFSSASNIVNVTKQNPLSNPVTKQSSNSNKTTSKSDISVATKTNSLLQLSRSLPAQLVQAHACRLLAGGRQPFVALDGGLVAPL